MTTLVITRGLPGSGKTTYARRWVADDPNNRVRVNRDDLRAMMDNGQFILDVTEPRIRASRDALVRFHLAEGTSVIVDDTNLPRSAVHYLRTLARGARCRFQVVNFTSVPLQTCIARDAARGERAVGAEVIKDMHARFLAGSPCHSPGATRT
ncbi:AAA family ATPase [Saccharopolyspora sp. K220]|uniref:AAA family ATPase n=1 Tax=Saccharopolyspora soli TaxID=2926618 RepID=UPI001F5AF25E|nr:AAA family ATPase [Saccharopolyspora soli]MCI2422480.1 AAA family ATPase [Saccharopolyspora soli]